MNHADPFPLSEEDHEQTLLTQVTVLVSLGLERRRIPLILG